MPVAVQSYAERFAANWKAQNPTDQEEEQASLDDSLTNLQWLHSISIQDIAPSTTSIAPSPSPSTNSCDSDDRSDTSDGFKDVHCKEPNIDYKNDANHKPPYSYATLICMAMRETNKTKITLSAIYKWIKENFMYYRVADPTWQVNECNLLLFNKNYCGFYRSHEGKVLPACWWNGKWRLISLSHIHALIMKPKMMRLFHWSFFL